MLVGAVVDSIKLSLDPGTFVLELELSSYLDVAPVGNFYFQVGLVEDRQRNVMFEVNSSDGGL